MSSRSHTLFQNSFARDMVAKVRRHAALAADYGRVGAWLIRDYLAYIGWRALSVVALGGAHIVTKYLAMGAVYVLVLQLSEGPGTPIAGHTLPALEPRALLIVGVIVAVGLMVASALLQYGVRLQSVRFGRRYEEYCVRRFLAAVSRLPHPKAGEANRIISTEPMHLFAGYSRRCGVIARKLTQLMPTVVSLLVGCAVIIWIDAALTFWLGFIGAAVIIAQYPPMHRSAKASTDWEIARRAASRHIKTFADSLRRSPLALQQDGRVIDRLAADGPVRDRMDAYAERSYGGELASVLSRVGKVVLLGAALLLLGLDIVDGTATWAGIAAYVAALRFTLSDLQTTSSVGAGIGSHHEQITRYSTFVRSASLADASQAGTAPTALHVEVPAIDDGAGPAVLRAGMTAALLVPPRCSPMIPTMLVDALRFTPGEHYAAPVRLDEPLIDGGVSLRDALGLPQDTDETRIDTALHQFVPSAQTAPLGNAGWLDRPGDPDWNMVLPEWTLCALRALAAAERGAGLVIIGGNVLARMDQRWRNACASHLAHCPLIVVHQDIHTIGTFDEVSGLVGDGERLTGWAALCDIERGRQVLAAALPASVTSDTDQPLVDEGSDDDDM